MFKKLLIFVACSCVLLLSGCDESDNNTSSGTITTVRDLTVYQEQLSEIFEGEFSGTIEDGDSEVLCQYDGRQFVLSLEFASPMSCIGPDGRKTNCTKAVTGFLALKGGLVIDSDAEISVTGQVDLFNGLHIIKAYLQVDGDYLAKNFVFRDDHDMGTINFDSVITQLEWFVNHQDTGWEVCVLSISP